jgi:hypothetical protein
VGSYGMAPPPPQTAPLWIADTAARCAHGSAATHAAIARIAPRDGCYSGPQRRGWPGPRRKADGV